MIVFIEIFLFLLFLLNQTHGNDKDILLFNDPTHDHLTNYEVIRNKRDQSPWFYPEIDRNQISCGHNVYVKLYTCSQLTECRYERQKKPQ